MLYDKAGVEPPMEDILYDPIFRHLRQYDGLPVAEWPELEWWEPDFRHAA
jgi:hypothetical protein